MNGQEHHLGGLSGYIKDIVYGATDGIITTFAIIAGSAGAHFSTRVVIILGIANLLADGFSMAASNFLGTTSEQSLFRREKKREEREVEEVPEKEKGEVREILMGQGLEQSKAAAMTDLISSHKPFWVDFMMRYELGMNIPTSGEAWKGALLTFVSFILAGVLPLLPFLLFGGSSNQTIYYSTIATAITLFVVGAARKLVTGVNWFLSGLEMLLIGGIAAGVSYGVGSLISVVI